jgi:hypothetical protein
MKTRTHTLASPTGRSIRHPSNRRAGSPPKRHKPLKGNSGGEGFLIVLCLILALSLALIVGVFYAIL